MSVLEELLQGVESDLNLVRRDLKGRVGPIRDALAAYERAVEEESVLAYCRDHSLKKPPLVGMSVERAAAKLFEAVQALPEIDVGQAMLDVPPESPKALPSVPPPEDEVMKKFLQRFPALTAASRSGRLLVFGAFAGRTKSLPGPLAAVTDWVDTATEGNRLVESSVKRIRGGHVFGVIVCEQAIQHQHSEPVTDVCRGRKLPLAYAGKGGNASLARALESLENSLHGL